MDNENLDDCYPTNSLTLNVEFDGDNDVIGDEDESVILITILVSGGLRGTKGDSRPLNIKKKNLPIIFFNLPLLKF